MTGPIRKTVLAVVVVATATVTAWATHGPPPAIPMLSVSPNPVPVTCPPGNRIFTISAGSGGGSGANITGFVGGPGCGGYTITPGSGFVPAGGSAQFTAFVASPMSASCDFSIYVDGSLTPYGFQVTSTGCGGGGALVLSPGTLDVGDVPVGQAQTRSFTSLQNMTGQTLTTLRYQVFGTGFETGFPCDGDPDNDCTVTVAIPPGGFYTPPPVVRCRPGIIGPMTGSASVTGNGVVMTASSLRCNGTNPVSEPAIGVNPPSLVRSAPVGQIDSGGGPIAISNSGDQDLRITRIAPVGIHAGAWSAPSTCTPATPCVLAHNQTLPVTVTYTAGTIGDESTTIEIDSNDPNTPTLGVPATGTGLGAILVLVSPSSHMIGFGTVAITTQSAPADVVVRNDGNAPVTIRGTMTGAPTFTRTPTGTVTLAPGPANAQTFQVSCTPPMANVYSGRIDVEGVNAMPAVATQSVTLSCTGINSQVDISPAMIDFGPIRVGTDAPTRDITITNNGPTITLTDAMLATAGTGFQIVSAPPSGTTLATTDTATITIGFSPTAAGPDTNSVNNMVMADPTRSVTLLGAGAIASATVDPISIDGAFCVGDLLSSRLTLTSTGDAPVVASFPELDGDPAFSYMAVNGTAFPVTLTMGATATVDVYATVPAGHSTATVHWPTDLPTPLDDIPVAVDGQDSGVAASPGSVDFGRFPVGDASPVHDVSVKACGGESIGVGAAIADDAAQAFTLTGPSSATITAMATVWTVQFTAPGGGAYHATLRLTPTTGGDPIDIPLLGVGEGGTTNYYACGCNADTGGLGGAVVVVAFAIGARRRRRAARVAR